MSCSKWLVNYPNKIFVETGSGGGAGIQNALNYGFEEIHSIEINPSSYKSCVELFKKAKNVNLYLGDSLDFLPKILEKIKTGSTFLLDAHIMNLDQVHGKMACPVLKELDIIINHSLENKVKHSILVDDAKLFNGKTKSFSCIKIDDIRKVVVDIDPAYVVKAYRRMIVIK